MTTFNLKGLWPDSWWCVDCGVNTAPGCPNRGEIEQAFAAGQESVKVTISARSEIYTVRAAIWKKAGIKPMGGCLCIGCLEQRLGRRLKPEDFDPCQPLNIYMPGTPRLLRRQERPRMKQVTMNIPPPRARGKTKPTQFKRV
jgi:hypothetical protein